MFFQKNTLIFKQSRGPMHVVVISTIVMVAQHSPPFHRQSRTFVDILEDVGENDTTCLGHTHSARKFKAALLKSWFWTLSLD